MQDQMAVLVVVFQLGVRTTVTAVLAKSASRPLIVMTPEALIVAAETLPPAPGAEMPEPAPVNSFRFWAASVIAVLAALADNNSSDTLARAV